MKFSYSMLNQWMTCPLQAYFSEVLELPEEVGSKTTYGSVIHEALAHYNRTGDIDASIKLFCDGWEDPRTLGLPDITRWDRFTSYGGLRQRGLDVLRDYHDRMRWEQRQILAVEHRFKIPIGDHELSGIVDLLSIRKNHKGKELLTIEDFKTGSRLPRVAELALNIQGTVYSYAVGQPEFWLGRPGEDEDRYKPLPNGEWLYETIKDMPRRFLWVSVWNEYKELDGGTRDDEDFARLYRLCNQVERAIELKVFVPKVGEHCGFCSFAHDPCPQNPPTLEEWQNRLETDENSWPGG